MNRIKGFSKKLNRAYILNSLMTTGHTGNQFVRFALVGGSGVFVNLAVYSGSIYLLHFHYLLSATFSFLVAMTNNFILNLRWTFKTHNQGIKAIRDQYLRYAMVTLISYGINMAVLWTLVDSWHWHKILAQLMAIFITTLSNFLGSKLWAFKLNPV
ncbi:MAG: GtrA family protein [Deltaproteobacteria bacterium]|nr:GtrA family protein [Deltaproteobacteria bacterium]